jgi:hypothetical protein
MEASSWVVVSSELWRVPLGGNTLEPERTTYKLRDALRN